jgi:hypothetical protein
MVAHCSNYRYRLSSSCEKEKIIKEELKSSEWRIKMKKGLLVLIVAGSAAGLVVLLSKKAKAAGNKVELGVFNYDVPAEYKWSVVLYDNTGLQQATVDNPNPDGSIVKWFTESLKYSVPADFTYPLKMILLVQPEPFSVINIRQSLGPGYTGIYDPDFVIHQPGNYMIDYTTGAIMEA